MQIVMTAAAIVIMIIASIIELREYNTKKYTVCYNAQVFEGDAEGWNSIDTDDLSAAMEFCEVHAEADTAIRDNRRNRIFHNGEWR